MSLLYLPLSQGFLGFSLGQFSLGLRLISNDGTSHFKKATLRNSLYIPIFLLNYLRIKDFFVYRLTWQDQVSQTRIIDLNEDDSFFNKGSCLNSLSVFIFLVFSVFTFKIIGLPMQNKTTKPLALKKKNKVFVLLVKKTPNLILKPLPKNLVTVDFKSYYKEYRAAKRNSLISAAVRAPANYPEPPTPHENLEEVEDGLKDYNSWRHRSRARFHIK